MNVNTLVDVLVIAIVAVLVWYIAQWLFTALAVPAIVVTLVGVLIAVVAVVAVLRKIGVGI